MLSTKELYERLEQTTDQHEHLHILFDIATSLLNTNEQRTIEVAEQLLQLAEKLDSNIGRSYYHSTLGRIAYRKSNFGQVAAEFQKALDYSLLSDDLLTQAMCYDSLGIVLGSLGEYQKSIETSLHALATYQQIDTKASHWQQLSCYNNLGVLYKALYKLSDAEKCYREGMHILQYAPNERMRYNLTVNYGEVVLLTGRPEDALAYAMEAIAGFKNLNHRIGECHAYLLIGKCYLAVGAFAKASQQFIAAQKLCKEIGHRAIEAETYQGMGDIYMKMGGEKEAGEQYGKTFKIAVEINNYPLMCQSYSCMGNYYLTVGLYEEALPMFEDGLALATKKHMEYYTILFEKALKRMESQKLKAS